MIYRELIIIDVKVSPKLAEEYYANGEEMLCMNDAQRIRFQAHKKWLADLSSLETDVIRELTDAAYWYCKHFERVIINEHHTICVIIAERMDLGKMTHSDALIRLGIISRSYSGRTERFHLPEKSVKEIKVMHENSLFLPTGYHSKAKYKALYAKAPPEGLGALEGGIMDGWVSTILPLLEGC
jgi:hypothetical protein